MKKCRVLRRWLAYKVGSGGGQNKTKNKTKNLLKRDWGTGGGLGNGEGWEDGRRGVPPEVWWPPVLLILAVAVSITMDSIIQNIKTAQTNFQSGETRS